MNFLPSALPSAKHEPLVKLVTTASLFDRTLTRQQHTLRDFMVR